MITLINIDRVSLPLHKASVVIDHNTLNRVQVISQSIERDGLYITSLPPCFEMADVLLNAGTTAGGGLYREFRFLPSHSAAVELQCGISRLEVPIAALQSMTEKSAECFVSAYIMACQGLFSLHEAPVRTHFSSLDPVRGALVWDYVLSLPVRIRDLPRDSMMVFAVRTESGELLGTAYCKLFDPRGRLKSGRQKLVFSRSEELISPYMSTLNNSSSSTATSESKG